MLKYTLSETDSKLAPQKVDTGMSMEVIVAIIS